MTQIRPHIISAIAANMMSLFPTHILFLFLQDGQIEFIHFSCAMIVHPQGSLIGGDCSVC